MIDLLDLIEKYYNKPLGFGISKTRDKKKFILSVDDCEWYGDTVEECVAQAVEDYQEWIFEKTA